MQTAFDAHMKRRLQEQKVAVENTKCKPPQKTEAPIVAWPSVIGHKNALDGGWPGWSVSTIGAGGESGSNITQGGDHKKIKITGYGAQARVRAMILEELMKSEYGKNQTGTFDPNKPDGDYLLGLQLKYAGRGMPSVGPFCKPLTATRRRRGGDLPQIDSLDSTTQIIVKRNMIGGVGCQLYVCLNLKITAGKDSEGRIVLGWGALGEISKDGAKAAIKKNGNLTDVDPLRCQQEQNKFTMAVDQALRQAVARFRFEAAQCLLSGTWFSMTGKTKTRKTGHGFGCEKKQEETGSSSY